MNHRRNAEIVCAPLLCHFIGRMLNEAAFASHPLLVNEMMPTTIRTISCTTMHWYHDLSGGKISHLILAGLSFVAALLAITLPEIKGKPMPEDLDV
ncbi:unnamed protein product [Thelazia callipaeda]|uniref:MFS domain-containing protein n=1 Tax=Thelazia callipaeda TaxID=103827 RepID=A0A0N5CS95_THECL|nr:unnamed protein product [Thelazia callipaeda]